MSNDIIKNKNESCFRELLECDNLFGKVELHFEPRDTYECRPFDEIRPPRSVDVYCRKCSRFKTKTLIEPMGIKRVSTVISATLMTVLENINPEIAPELAIGIVEECGFFSEFYQEITKKGTMIVEYNCPTCNDKTSYFISHIDSGFDSIIIQKVATYPPIRPTPDKVVADELKRMGLLEIYRQGRSSEQYGHGIGAHAYYRRIVENIIDHLLEEVLSKDNQLRTLFDSQGGKMKTESKIDAISDYYEKEFGIKMFKSLHQYYVTLSEGIHSRSDKDCLVYAEVLRGGVEQIILDIFNAKRRESVQKMHIDKINALKSKQT